MNQTGTGANQLKMQFVGGNALPYEIIRQPPNGEDSTSALGQSREYNMAQIRVLLADAPGELPPGAGNTEIPVHLANIAAAGSFTYLFGVPMAAANIPGTFPAGTYQLYFATAANGIPTSDSVLASGNAALNGKVTTPTDWPSAPQAFALQSFLQGLQPAGAPIIPGSNAPTTLTLCPPANPANGIPAGCPGTPTSLTPGNPAPSFPYYAVQPGGVVPSWLTIGTAAWNLIDGYLRVEYKDDNGVWHGVTQEWLSLGFARGQTPPTAPGQPITAGSNPINPNAILLLQEPADRTTSGTPPTVDIKTGIPPKCIPPGANPCTQWTATPFFSDTGAQWEFGTNSAAMSLTAFNWYPINFYDAREGEARDVIQGNNSCTTNGVMNAVEIDVGNLNQWLSGVIGTSGKSVNYTAQNGYVLYFSDRRGMLLNPNTTGPHPAGKKSGDSGLEDVVNAASQAGTPDGGLEPPGGNASPEDVNQNKQLDDFGVANLGLGFYNGATNLNGAIIGPDNPYSPRITSCSVTGRKNWVSGARHVLKLVDGSFPNVPRRWDAAATLTSPGGFTVASENPVYIQGNYNSDAADTFFSNPTNTAPANDKLGHSAAAVIADAVTLLSKNWDDRISMGVGNLDVTDATTRPASTTYYRVAIAAGKNRPFPFPGWAKANPDYPFGTDGGLGNFLRLLENWQTAGTTLNYGGSLVSLYYATYDTGIFKCCTYSVYQPPRRNYRFDVDFALPEGLPPGTPMFRDVESLGFRQLFTARTN